MNTYNIDKMYENYSSEIEKMQKCIDELQQENQELNKQLEEINKFKFSYRKDETKISPMIRKQKDVEIIKNLENQQKDFINYINSYIELLKDKPDLVEEGQKDILEEILSKYKEIIGGKDEKEQNKIPII